MVCLEFECTLFLSLPIQFFKNLFSFLITGPEGVETFCRELGVEPENVALLVLAWKMGAKQMGYFTQEEWLTGLKDLQ